MASKSQILILGGSGRVGQLIIADALAQGFQVTALVRKPDSLAPQANLASVVGSPTSSTDILKAITAISDFVDTPAKSRVTIISTLGQTRVNSSNPWSATTSPAYFMSHSTEAVVEALRRITPSRSPTSGSMVPAEINLNVVVEKYMVLSAFGTGDSHPHLHWSLRWVMAHSNMRQMVEDHNRVIEIVQQNLGGQQQQQGEGVVEAGDMSSLLPIPFVIVRPVMLKFDQTGDVPAVKEYGHGQPGMGMMLHCDTRSVSRFLLEKVEDNGADNTMPVIST